MAELEVEWAVASRPRSGESASGDGHLVRRRGAQLLAAVVDGLGHGPVAHEAAELALSALARASKWDPEELFRSCHASARSTRGVVMALSLLDLERGTMTWAGIGNVEGVLLAPTGAKQSLVARSGVVGYEVPPLRPATVPLSPGAGLILATDGITSGFDAQVQLEDPPGRTAAKILAGHGRSDDDALVLVVLARDGRSLARGA